MLDYLKLFPMVMVYEVFFTNVLEVFDHFFTSNDWFC